MGALNYMEAAGEVRHKDQLVGLPDVNNALKEFAVAGAHGQGRRTQKHAERYPAMLVVALELNVLELLPRTCDGRREVSSRG